MTLLFIDGFDHYTNATSAGMNQFGSAETSATGRYGDGRYKSFIAPMPVSGEPAGITFTTSLSSFVIGIALRASTNAGGWKLKFGSLLTVTGTLSTGAITVSNGNFSYSSNNALIYTDIWDYIEVKVVTGTSGSFAVRLNGVAVPGLIDRSSVNIGAGSVSSLTIESHDISYACNADDFYLCDLNGSVNNDFLGEVRVETIRPSGAGSSGGWSTSVVSGVNYQMVDEATTNSDSDYVYSNVVDNKDLYAASNLATVITGSVLGVQVNLHARKTDSGTRGIKSVIKVGASEADGPEHGTIATSYKWFWDVRENKPGGTGWTISDVNGAEIGVKVSS